MSQKRQTTTKIQQAKAETSFPFLGEALALDVTNTNILLRGKRHEFLATPADAAQWWREASLQHPERDIVEHEEMTQWDDTLLQELKRLRDTLRSLFTAVVERRLMSERDLEELNRVLALGQQVLTNGSEGEPVSIYRTVQLAYGAVLVPIALSAIEVLTRRERSRLHKCANERCVGLFYDTTRSATRHWCSSECMNRARSIENYRKMKEQKAQRAAHAPE